VEGWQAGSGPLQAWGCFGWQAGSGPVEGWQAGSGPLQAWGCFGWQAGDGDAVCTRAEHEGLCGPGAVLGGRRAVVSRRAGLRNPSRATQGCCPQLAGQLKQQLTAVKQRLLNSFEYVCTQRNVELSLSC